MGKKTKNNNKKKSTRPSRLLTDGGIEKLISHRIQPPDERDLPICTLQVIDIIPEDEDYCMFVLSDGKYYVEEVYWRPENKKGTMEEYLKERNIQRNCIIRIESHFNGEGINLGKFGVVVHKKDRIGSPTKLEYEPRKSREKKSMHGKQIDLTEGGIEELASFYDPRLHEEARRVGLQILDIKQVDKYDLKFTLSDGKYYLQDVYYHSREYDVKSGSFYDVHGTKLEKNCLICVEYYKRNEDDDSIQLFSFAITLIEWDKKKIGNPTEIKYKPLTIIEEEEISDYETDGSVRYSNEEITDGAIENILANTGNPRSVINSNNVLQVIKIKRIKYSNFTRYRMELSDGKHYIIASPSLMREIRMKNLFEIQDGTIRKNSLLKLTSYTRNNSVNTNINLVDVKNLGVLKDKVGNPIHIESVLGVLKDKAGTPIHIESVMKNAVKADKDYSNPTTEGAEKISIPAGITPKNDGGGRAENYSDDKKQNETAELSLLKTKMTTAAMNTTSTTTEEQDELISFSIQYKSELEEIQTLKKEKSAHSDGKNKEEEEYDSFFTKSIKTEKSGISFQLLIYPYGNCGYRRKHGWVSLYLLCMDSFPNNRVNATGFIRQNPCGGEGGGGSQSANTIPDIPFQKVFKYAGDFRSQSRLIKSEDLLSNYLDKDGNWRLEIHFSRILVTKIQMAESSVNNSNSVEPSFAKDDDKSTSHMTDDEKLESKAEPQDPSPIQPSRIPTPEGGREQPQENSKPKVVTKPEISKLISSEETSKQPRISNTGYRRSSLFKKLLPLANRKRSKHDRVQEA